MLFSTVNALKAGNHIDKWFASVVKPKSFYEKHACAGLYKCKVNESNVRSSTRCYFYNIDLQGRLFLEETIPKNITTSLKDERFLDFFFSRIRYTNDKQQDYMRSNDIPVEDYPFVSVCGRELNFIRPAATPIVYHSIISHDDDTRFTLGYGGNSLTQPFDAIQGIAISRETGRLYHKLTARMLSRGDSHGNVVCSDYGLIRSSVVVALSDRIIQDFSAFADNQCHSGMGFKIGDNDMVVRIPWLPSIAEPGSWAIQSEFDDV